MHNLKWMRMRDLNWMRIRTIDQPDAEGQGSGDPDPQTQGQAGKPDQGQGDEPLGEGGKKALEAERQAAKTAKAKAAELEAKLKEYEDRDKSEEQKQAEKLEQLQHDAEASRRKATQYEVAASKGIPLKLATRLRGETAEEMAQDAEELSALIGAADPKPVAPKPDKSQGMGGGPKPANLAEAIAEYYKQ